MKVLIDCGHHNLKPGESKIFDDVQIMEHLYVREIANMLDAERYSEDIVELPERVDYINSYLGKDDLVISIHCNSFHNSGANGYESFHYSNSIKSKECSDKFIEIFDIGLENRGSKPAEYYILKYTKPRAILIELGFLSNRKDFKYLLNNKELIASKIQEYIDYERNKV